jgi:hypothetical protein
MTISNDKSNIAVINLITSAMTNKREERYHYKKRTIRLADEVWELFKELRRESGGTFNLFVRSLLTNHKNNGQKKNN